MHSFTRMYRYVSKARTLLDVSRYDLLIFDLDGTLVPTEEMASRLLARLIVEHLSLEMTHEEHRDKFLGLDMNTQLAELSLMYGAPLPQSFFDALDQGWTEAVRSELQPSIGVIDALIELESVPRCIASNSYAEGIALALQATGLDKYFDTYFSADDVVNPKPAPDMHLLAAKTFDVSPERCLVIEDSVLGIKAARAAGMDVVGYTGNAPHSLEALSAEGVRVISHFVELAEVVRGS